MKRTRSTLPLLALALALALPTMAQPPADEPETETGYGFQGEFGEEAGSDPFDDPAVEADPWSEADAATGAGSEEPFDSLSQPQHDAFAADPADPQDAGDTASEPVAAGASTSGELRDGLKRMFVGVLMPAVERRVRKAVEGDDAPQSDPVPQADP